MYTVRGNNPVLVALNTGPQTSSCHGGIVVVGDRGIIGNVTESFR
jgi:hypothetical protein